MSTTNTPILQPLCYLCISENIPSERQGRKLHINCEKCYRCYCDLHASQFIPLYCQPCLSDIQITKQDFISAGVAQTYIRDENGDIILGEDGKPKVERKYYSTRSKQIIMFGTDWLFSEMRWSDLDETQAEQVLEYHKAAISFLEQVITQHRIIKAHKLAAVRIPITERIEKKARKREERSLDALAQSMAGNMKSEDLAKLIEKLQASVKK